MSLEFANNLATAPRIFVSLPYPQEEFSTIIIGISNIEDEVFWICGVCFFTSGISGWILLLIIVATDRWSNEYFKQTCDFGLQIIEKVMKYSAIGCGVLILLHLLEKILKSIFR